MICDKCFCFIADKSTEMKVFGQKPFSKIMSLLVITMVPLLSYVSAYRLVSKSGSGMPCAKCDLQAIHPFEIEKLAPVCAACGDVFGYGYEHCCMCHEYFYDKCISAFRR